MEDLFPSQNITSSSIWVVTDQFHYNKSDLIVLAIEIGVIKIGVGTQLPCTMEYVCAGAAAACQTTRDDPRPLYSQIKLIQLQATASAICWPLWTGIGRDNVINSVLISRRQLDFPRRASPVRPWARWHTVAPIN